MSKELEALKNCLDEIEKRRDELMNDYRAEKNFDSFWYICGQLDELASTSKLLMKLYDKLEDIKSE
jgi:hypothetical protein